MGYGDKMKNRLIEQLVLSLTTVFVANVSWSQQPDQFYLQDLPPVGKLIQSPAPNLNAIDNTAITLESIPKAQLPAPLSLEPLQRVQRIPSSIPSETMTYNSRNDCKESSSMANQKQLSVDEMIGRQSDASLLFSRVNSVDDQSNADANPAPIIRYQVTQDLSEADWAPYGYAWHSPAFCYSRLYFEQPNLERYGSGYGHMLSPAVSATHFYGSTLTLPFKALFRAPWTCDCTLGHHRPGNCTPHQRKHAHFVHQSLPLTAQAKTIVSDTSTLAGEFPQSPVATDQATMEPIVAVATGDLDTNSPVTTASIALPDPASPESELFNSGDLSATPVVYRRLSDTSQ
jgi:hypothetical protein